MLPKLAAGSRAELYLGFWSCSFDHFSCPRESSTCSPTRDPVVQSLTNKIQQNFRTLTPYKSAKGKRERVFGSRPEDTTRGIAMVLRIGRILKLSSQKPPVGLCKFFCLQQSATTPASRENTFRTIPVPLSSLGVRMTLAPKARIIFLRSMEKVSTIVATKG